MTVKNLQNTETFNWRQQIQYICELRNIIWKCVIRGKLVLHQQNPVPVIITNKWTISKSYIEFGASMNNYSGDGVTVTSCVHILDRCTKLIRMSNSPKCEQCYEIRYIERDISRNLVNLHRRAHPICMKTTNMTMEHDETDHGELWSQTGPGHGH